MESALIHNGVLEFDEETHTYWFNQKKCVSITQVESKIHPNKYKNVNPEVLHKAANGGTIKHNAVECYVKYGLENNEIKEFRNFKWLTKVYMLTYLESELFIVIEYKDHYFCGRLDLIGMEPDGSIVIIDEKYTSVLDKQYVTEQTALYKLGVQQTYEQYKNVSGTRVMWLKNDNRKYIVLDQIDPYEILDKYLEIENDIE